MSTAEDMQVSHQELGRSYEARSAWRVTLSRHGVRGAVALIGLTVVTLVLYPLITIVVDLFVDNGRITTQPISDALGQPYLGEVLVNTLVIVGLAAVFGLVSATILAWLAERTDATLGPVASIVPIIPLLIPTLAAVIGWQFLLAPSTGLLNQAIRAVIPGIEEGPLDLNNRWGMIFVMGLYLVSFAYLIIAAALREIDPDLEAASRVCGAGLLRTFWHVTLPSIRPALASAAVLVTMLGLAMLAIPLVIGTAARIDILSSLIFRVLVGQSRPDLPQGLVLSSFVLMTVLLAVILQRVLVRGRRFELISGRAKARRRVRLGVHKWPARFLFVMYIVVSVLLPVAALVIVSLEKYQSATIPWHDLGFTSYRTVLDDMFMTAAIKHSIVLGLLASIIAMLFAFALAWNTHAYRQTRIGGALLGVATLPAGVPHLVIGVGFLVAFSRGPLVLYGSTVLLLIAYVTIWMPQGMQAAQNGVRQVGRDYIEASRIAGATELRTLQKIALPVALPQMMAGAVVIFVFTMGEFNASIMLATPTGNVAGPALFSLWELGVYPNVAAYALLIMAVNITVLTMATITARIVRRG